MKVILVFFDTMRYDHASCNGYPYKITPNIDRLAAEGAKFTNSYPSDIPTQPCYTSTLFGKRGINTGVVSHGQSEETFANDVPTFPDILAVNGVLTAAVSTLYRFRRWFAKGFTHYLQPDIKTWLQHVTADQVNEQAIPWLKSYGKTKDFFLFLHYWDPHTPYNQNLGKYVKRFYKGDPYDPKNHSFDDLRSRPLMYFFISGGAIPELKRGLKDIQYTIAQYDAEIAYADGKFGDVLDTLDKLEVLDDTMIIFTSDHGEAIYEHGVYHDHMDAYEQTAHVPLVIWYPKRVKKQKIDALVQHIDFAPTILEAFGIKVPERFEGKSLWPLLEGKKKDHYDAVFTNQGLWSSQRVMRTKKWSLVKTIDPGMLIDLPPIQLFDRQKDLAESKDLAPKMKDIVDELELEYLHWVESQLGNRPDPLRIICQEPTATDGFKRRYREIMGKEFSAKELTPEDRAKIDNNPKI